MCLYINNFVKLPKVNKEGYCVGYKTLSFDNLSIYRYYRYVKGINKSNRKTKDMDGFERCSNNVRKGIHVYLNSEFANRDIISGNADKIIKVYFKPEDVIKTGTFEERDCAVVMEVLVKSLNDIRKSRKVSKVKSQNNKKQ